MSELIETTPSKLLEIAVSNNADVDKLERLMDMQIKWEANEARKAFVVAMTEFRAEAPTIAKNKTAHNSRYATINQITETVNPILSKHGLSFAWVTEQNGSIIVHCDITHIQGHSQRVSLSASADNTGSKNDIQAIGSTVSYLQRYTLLSALGLATGEDDNDAQIKDSNARTADPDSPVVAKLQLAAEQGKAALQEAWKGLQASERNSVPTSAFREMKKQVGW